MKVSDVVIRLSHAQAESALRAAELQLTTVQAKLVCNSDEFSKSSELKPIVYPNDAPWQRGMANALEA